MPKPTAVLHENVPLLQVSEPIMMDALLADAVAARYILTRLSATAAVVAPEGFDALVARLIQLRHLPKVVES